MADSIPTSDSATCERILENLWDETADALRETLLDGVTIEGSKKYDRAIFIGDVHGCIEELQLLLKKCNYDEKKDLVIFVGDLIGKGPESVKVVRYIHSRFDPPYCVMGNHDEVLARYHQALLQARYKKQEIKEEKEHNPASAEVKEEVSIAPIDEKKVDLLAKFTEKERKLIADRVCVREKYVDYYQEMTLEEREFIAHLPLWYKISPNNFTEPKKFPKVLVVHAGLDPRYPLQKQSRTHLSTMRSILSDGSPFVGIDQGTPWIHHYQGPELVVFGHDAQRKLQRSEYTCGLDTGCCYGGELSALVLPANEVVAVKALSVYSKPTGVLPPELQHLDTQPATPTSE